MESYIASYNIDYYYIITTSLLIKNTVNINDLNKTSLKNKVAIRIFSTDGREIFHIEKNKNDLIQLNLQSLNSGIYQIRIDDGEQFITDKIIKI